MSMRILLSIKTFLAASLLLSVIYFMASVPWGIADDDHRKRHEHRDENTSSSLDHGNGDEGNELTGESAAWVFAAANLTVAFSLIAKGLTRYAPLTTIVRDRVKRLNQVQKRYLMPTHYFLNPLALILAFIHFSLSRCPSSSFPEWGLAVMAILTGIGMMLKYKILPKSIRGTVYQIHTNPFLLGLLLLVLLIGHSIID
jgi:hypothetical protein